MNTQEPTRYNLGSSTLIHAPGIINWARSFMRTDPAKAVGLVCDTWGIPTDAVEYLLRNPEAAEVCADEEVVSFTYPPEPEES